jgi:pimeloyl-ACP methyl ester carboxylesterase
LRSLNATDPSYQFAAAFGFGEPIRIRPVRRIEQTFGVPSAHFDIPPVAASVDTPPVLLVHDEDDTETNLSESEAIRRTWPASRLVTTRRLGHHRILRDPDVLARAVSFVTE